MTEEAQTLLAQQTKLTAQWEREKATLEGVRELKAQIEQASPRTEQAESGEPYPYPYPSS